MIITILIIQFALTSSVWYSSSARFGYSVLDYLLMLSVFHTRQYQMTRQFNDY
jgi:hypothetical protein